MKFDRHVVLFVVLMLLVSALVGPVALAQEVTETPDPAPTEAPEEPVEELPDLSPVVDEFITGVDGFLQRHDTQVLMGAVAFVVIALARIVLPNTELDTKAIFTLVVFGFTGLYVLANLFGGDQWLARGVEIGAIISRTVATIIALLAVPSALYAVVGKGLDNPLVVRPQGDRWFKLEDKPEVVGLQAFTEEVEAEYQPSGDPDLPF